MKHALLYLVVAAISGLATAANTKEGQMPATGPLEVHPVNPRWFADGAGRAIWLTGSHTWASRQERGVEGTTPDFDYAGYLAFLQRHGHNCIRLWAWEHAQWMQEYLVYLPDGGKVTVDLSAAKGGFAAEWIESKAGKTGKAETVQGGASREFSAPFQGDAVLLIVGEAP